MNHVNDLASALYSALYVDLPDLEYKRFQNPQDRKSGVEPEAAYRRPTESDVVIDHFEQIWGSTALGHGGMGGAAITPAATTVVTCRTVSAVYFGGRYCYSVKAHCDNFLEDLVSRACQSKRKAVERYEMVEKPPLPKP